jgi:hypothetical protein
MGKREIYLLDESTGQVLERFNVTGWSVNRILELERKLYRQASDDVVVKDSMFDREP